MINVKISLPGAGSDSSFEKFIDPNSKDLKNIKFHINNEIKEADFWFVFEDLYKQNEECLINRKKIIYLNTETSYPSSYFLSTHLKKYLSQFYRQYGCYETFSSNYENTNPFLPWMINYKTDNVVFSNKGLGVEGLGNLKNLEKTKNISVICSNKQLTDNHKMRYEFTKNLKSYFGSDIDWFGSGVNPIEDKWEGIKEYKYHIVIENGQKNNLISEKLFDSYLGLSYPIYYGAPNVGEYFPTKSFKSIDINNFQESIRVIENLLNSNTYEKSIESLTEARNLVLGKHNFLNRIYEIIKDLGLEEIESSKQRVVLKNVHSFWKENVPLKRKVKHNIVRKLRL